MFVRLPNLGSIGVIHDTVAEALPSGAFTDALNMRFTGVEMQKMLEPEISNLWDYEARGEPVWMQTWADGLTTYLAVATAGALWLWRDDGVTAIGEFIDASRPNGYNTEGFWDSFAWGDTCIFNNGIDPPQIFNSDTAKFEDLPEWGLISTADDILNNRAPSRKVQAACIRLVPLRNFLVAVGVTEDGLYQPNKVWWSDSTNNAGYSGAPNWDYETPASLSGQIIVDPEGGAIRTAAQLNEQLIIYCDASTTAMQIVGGALVMAFRRLFNKGAAGLHSVAEFNNQHFVVSQDQIYIHDGSTVVKNLIAKDRVEEEFFKRIGKGGRFGDGSVIWDGIQVVKNPDRKEIIVSFVPESFADTTSDIPTCIPVSIVTQPVDGSAGGGTVTFTVVVGGSEPYSYQWYENGNPMSGETSSSVTVPDTSVSTYYVVSSNPCGSVQSNAVSIVGVCVPVTIIEQPTDQPDGGGTVTFTVATAGSEPITLQWQEDNAGDNIFADMVGEVSNSLTVADTSVNQYRVNTSNACGAETSAVVSVVPAAVPTQLFQDTGNYNGFHHKGMVVTNADGSVVMFAMRGYGYLAISRDSGATWSTDTKPMYDNSSYPTNCMRYDHVDDRWWAMVYREAVRGEFYWYSEDDGLTWTCAHPQAGAYWGAFSYTYAHSFELFNLSGGTEAFLFKQDSQNNGDTKAEIFDDMPDMEKPPDLGRVYSTGDTSSRSMWAVEQALGGTYAMLTDSGQGVSGQADGQIRWVPVNLADDGYVYKGTVEPRKTDTDHAETAVSVVGYDADGVSVLVTYITYNINPGIPVGTPVSLGGPILEGSGEIVYDNGSFIIFAMDETDRNLLRLTYTKPGDINTWFAHDPIVIPGTPMAWTDVSDGPKRQLIHWKGNEWLFAYVGDVGGTSGRGTLVSFEITVAP